MYSLWETKKASWSYLTARSFWFPIKNTLKASFVRKWKQVKAANVARPSHHFWYVLPIRGCKTFVECLISSNGYKTGDTLAISHMFEYNLRLFIWCDWDVHVCIVFNTEKKLKQKVNSNYQHEFTMTSPYPIPSVSKFSSSQGLVAIWIWWASPKCFVVCLFFRRLNCPFSWYGASHAS